MLHMIEQERFVPLLGGTRKRRREKERNQGARNHRRDREFKFTTLVSFFSRTTYNIVVRRQCLEGSALISPRENSRFAEWRTLILIRDWLPVLLYVQTVIIELSERQDRGTPKKPKKNDSQPSGTDVFHCSEPHNFWTLSAFVLL